MRRRYCSLSACARRECTAGPLPVLSMRDWMKVSSMALPISPPSASTSRTRWPLPVPPMAGLQGISASASRLSVKSSVLWPMRASASAASQPACPAPTTTASKVSKSRPPQFFLSMPRRSGPISFQPTRAAGNIWALAAPAALASESACSSGQPRRAAYRYAARKLSPEPTGLTVFHLRRGGVQLRARPEGERQKLRRAERVRAHQTAAALAQRHQHSPHAALDERPRRGGVGRAGQRLQLALVGLQKVGKPLHALQERRAVAVQHGGDAHLFRPPQDARHAPRRRLRPARSRTRPAPARRAGRKTAYLPDGRGLFPSAVPRRGSPPSGQSPLSRAQVSMTRVGAGTSTGSTSTPSSFASSRNRAPVSPPRGQTARASTPSAASTRATLTPLPPVCHSSRFAGRPNVLDPQRAVEAGVERQRTNFHITIIAHAAPSRAWLRTFYRARRLCVCPRGARIKVGKFPYANFGREGLWS